MKSQQAIFRSIILILMQVFVFQYVTLGLGSFNYVHIIIYPLIILMLPIRTSTFVLLIIAFIVGIIIDIFYNSPGVHTAALLLTAYMRPIVLNIIKPREGYGVNSRPNIPDQGFPWFILYSVILMFIHFFSYFSIEVFTFVYIFDIWMKTIFSFISSYFFVLIYQFLFEKKSK